MSSVDGRAQSRAVRVSSILSAVEMAFEFIS
jgi:hypothetical protein